MTSRKKIDPYELYAEEIDILHDIHKKFTKEDILDIHTLESFANIINEIAAECLEIQKKSIEEEEC